MTVSIFQPRKITAIIMTVVVCGCGPCEQVVINPTGEGEGDASEGEDTSEGEGDDAEGEGDASEGEGDASEGEGDANEGEGEARTCVFQALEEFNDFECEGDEDFCDPMAVDRVGPAADLMATWGRIEGDRVIIEARFRTLPFRTERTEVDLCLGSGWGFDGFSDNMFLFDPYETPASCENGVIQIGSTDPHRFPLSDGMPHGPVTPQSFGTLPYEHPYRGCDVYIGVNLPFIRYEFFSADYETNEYLFHTWRRIEFSAMPDASSSYFDISFLTIGGGVPDESIDYRSICELTCADLNGSLTR